MSITLTEKAAKEFTAAYQQTTEPEKTMLRVSVVGGGCSGFSYDLSFTDKFDKKTDAVSEQHGVTVVVDKKSDLYLDGTTIDYHDGLDKRGFTFDNPNAKNSCGCGSSFQA